MNSSPFTYVEGKIVPAKLVSQLAEILGSVDRIKKRGRNTFHNYDYVMEADLVEAVRGKLSENHIIITSSVDRTEVVEMSKVVKGEIVINKIGLLYVNYTFRSGETGETITVQGIGEIEQDGGKGIYKALTGAMKYMLMKNFLIDTGDDPEMDSKSKTATTAQQPKEKSQDPKGYTPAKDKRQPPTPAQQGLIKSSWTAYMKHRGTPEAKWDESLTWLLNKMFNINAKEQLTKMMASYLIDEIKRLQKEKPKPADNSGAPPEISEKEFSTSKLKIEQVPNIERLDVLINDLRALPRTPAHAKALEEAYENRKAFLIKNGK